MYLVNCINFVYIRLNWMVGLNSIYLKYLNFTELWLLALPAKTKTQCFLYQQVLEIFITDNNDPTNVSNRWVDSLTTPTFIYTRNTARKKWRKYIECIDYFWNALAMFWNYFAKHFQHKFSQCDGNVLQCIYNVWQCVEMKKIMYNATFVKPTFPK